MNTGAHSPAPTRADGPELTPAGHAVAIGASACDPVQVVDDADHIPTAVEVYGNEVRKVAA
jgi:hypothetical protein